VVRYLTDALLIGILLLAGRAIGQRRRKRDEALSPP
jgi:hypothetical protein